MLPSKSLKKIKINTSGGLLNIYYRISKKSIWPAQHDSNVLPKPLKEFVAAGMSMYFKGLDA
jgi:hypothetical protein